MSILNQIIKKEQEDIGDCTKCENFRPWDDGKCDIYGEPNFGVSVCHDFQLSRFWETKRGY